MRQRTLWIGSTLTVLAIAAIAAGIVSARAWASRTLARELVLAEQEAAAGHLNLAAQRLADLQRRWPGEPEVEFRLGVCQLARGRREEAIAAWARVPADAPLAALAAEKRATQLINTGRYTPAEAVLEAAVRRVEGRGGPDAEALRRALNRLYRFEGRVADVRRLIRAGWPQASQPVEALKELWFLDFTPQPIQSWSLALSKADPNDDRVWLGQAVVATLTGDFAEARRRLDACTRARPDDPAVWQAKLELALASGDEPALWDAAGRIPLSRLPRGEVLAIHAWVLGQRDDREAERKLLRTLVDDDPSRFSALDRLAELEAAAGRRDEAERLHRRKARLDDAKDRFRKALLSGDDLTTRAEELAGLTAALGRRFDAWAWSRLARDPAAPPAPPADPSIAGTLAAGLAALGLKPPAAPPTVAVTDPTTGPTAPEFRDVAETAGLSGFLFDNGRTPLYQLPETMSGGVALLDYDGDGRLDVYAVQGGPLDGTGPGDQLFRNKGDGTFEDVSKPSGVAAIAKGYGHGVAVGDVDGDGRPDVFVTRLLTYALYRNKGDGAFEDVTARAGLAGPRDAPSSAAFGDLDGDGDLDLYVAHYMKWDPDHPTICPTEKGTYFYCDPSKVERGVDHVFRNDGGRFVDVTKEAGFTDPDGRGLGVLIVDVDGDRRADVYVANDGTSNYLFMNKGGWRFEESAHAAGAAGNAEGGYQASMGVACGDGDGDGRPDLVVTNFYGESSTYYQNLGGGQFADRSAGSGVAAASRYLLGFGVAFLDYDDDGRLDLLTINGHVNDNRPYYPYAMPAQLLAGRPGGRFVDVSTRAGGVWSIARVGRGLAVGDVDDDGRLDAVVLAQNEPLAYFHNDTRGGRSLTLKLEGKTSNRDAVGAKVVVTTPDGRARTAWRFGGGSYQSASDPRLHFGLGAAERATTVEVRWPSGRTDRYRDLDAGAGYHLIEADPTPHPLPGFRPSRTRP